MKVYVDRKSKQNRKVALFYRDYLK